MPKINPLKFFTVVFAIIALLFAASQVGASSPIPLDGICTQEEMAAGECDVDYVNKWSYMVEVVPCSGKFPCYNAQSDETIFEYKITSDKKVQHFDLLVPTSCPQSETPPQILFSTPRGILYTDGIGSNKKFGRGLSSNDVYSVWYNKKNGYVSLVVDGNRTADISDLGLVRSAEAKNWARMQVLLPGCGAPVRSQTGAVTTAECLDVFIPADGGGETRLVSYSVQRGPGGCDVEDINQIGFFASPFCQGDPLDGPSPIPPPEGEDGEHQSFCGNLLASCPECVDVKLSCDGEDNYCVQYTTNNGAKIQQCIDGPNGESCDWGDTDTVDGDCADVFDDSIEAPCGEEG